MIRLLALLLLLAAPLAAQPAIPPAMACEALAGQEIAGLRITAANVTAEGRPAPVCHVRGTIGASTGVEAWLPTASWTGRYLQIGCGGLCGRINQAPPQVNGCVPFERGEFVLATTDMGHRDPSAASWGSDPQRRLDFAFRAVHLTAVATKAVITRYYGRSAERSYFSGCSDGGREGLVAALRYPGDFDGIIAGAPVLNFTVQNTFHHAWTVRQNLGSDGRAGLTADRLALLHRLVLAACGATDGVLADPRTCRFDPATAVCADMSACLTSDEARVAAAIYDGARAADGARLTTGGMMPGSEANWRGVIAPASATEPPRALLFSNGVIRNLAFWPNPPADYRLAFDGTTFARLAASQDIFDATNPDLAAFAARGGRLIVWHGWSDQDISPTATLAWWAALRRTLGAERTDRFARLFMVPGLAHCMGGQGATTLDTLTPMLAWVEAGTAPDRLIASGGGTRRSVAPEADVTADPWIGAGRFVAAPLAWCLGDACAEPR